MRISSAIGLLLMLAGCGGGELQPGNAAQDQPDPEQAANGIECAPPGETAFSRQCLLDRKQDDGGVVLTARLPDGGFHRFRLVQDGRTLAAADGAEPARVTPASNGDQEVAIGNARYRIPASALSPTR
ncbi:hypothetical protein NYR55_01775 [Sphingomonas sp. BGYR3]|uniref:hypothetical protein n=1 Tax=Sphingomonas sp. BGYR3 TaxID=2975483 RepID=UPI0021A8D88E|nr:hypothetical protein [Sphingomonas sp. BGYR3]MDG5487358.1 hypothetical protein [Sphingomonas sp. BGYR3]